MSQLEQEVINLGIRIEGTHTGLHKKTSKDDWGHDYDSWNVTLFHGNKCLETTFKTGIGLRKNKLPKLPSAGDVIYCLLSDRSSCTESFEDWCTTFGYDTDSRKALSTYLTSQESANKIRAFLGSALCDKLSALEH